MSWSIFDQNIMAVTMHEVTSQHRQVFIIEARHCKVVKSGIGMAVKPVQQMWIYICMSLTILRSSYRARIHARTNRLIVVGGSYHKHWSLPTHDSTSYCNRCLVGSGTGLEGAITSAMGERFRVIRDSLQAIGFSKDVSDLCCVFLTMGPMTLY